MMALYKDYRSKGVGKTESYKKVGEILGRNYQTIAAAVLRLSPSTGVAQDYLKSRALKMARRVVKEAKANELIDVLSRPNMGVLAPKQDAGGQTGFFLSVSVDTCGAVKVGAGSSGGWQPKQLEAAPEVIDVEPIERFEETADVKRTVGKSQAFQEALARAREKIRRNQEQQGIQGAHGHPQEKAAQVAQNSTILVDECRK